MEYGCYGFGYCWIYCALSEAIIFRADSLLSIPFDQAISKVTEALKEEGFGILTERAQQIKSGHR
jgi:uncharacterized protein (DUF302 family)